jgi:hypothetical protein
LAYLHVFLLPAECTAENFLKQPKIINTHEFGSEQ